MSSVALVTGASRGIGRATALALAGRGHAVAVNYRERVEDAKETLASITAAGGEGICVRADMSDAAEIERCFGEVEDALGGVDILVNNAGVRRDGLALRMSDDAWNDVMRTNLFGPFACSRRALKSMITRRSGRIVSVASVAGLRASPGQANYGAAKAGVIALTKTLAVEVATRGITVNAVAPGLIDTDLTSTLKPEQVDALVASIPQKQAGQPTDVADLIAWLCSEEARFVTGSVFVTDGGMTA
ncbi:MAG: 3-oxoacyl-ACP reductase FabG [Actinomycetota bacterium]|nr:3-oxoacyl-ACP reductase FabG [Actinomycetota bacterium]